jgi:hypothetical protein
MTALRRVVLAALPAWWLLLLVAPAFAQRGETSPQRRKELLEGTHVFRRILFDQKLEALDNFGALAEEQRRTILIMLGNLDRLGEVPGGLEHFIHRGGAVLLATDRAVNGDPARGEVAAVAGVVITGTTMVCEEDEERYKKEYCP